MRHVETALLLENQKSIQGLFAIIISKFYWLRLQLKCNDIEKKKEI